MEERLRRATETTALFMMTLAPALYRKMHSPDGSPSGNAKQPRATTNAPPSGPGKSGESASVGDVTIDKDKLLYSGNQLDKGGELTKAGRAIEKHGSRVGSIYPQATGNVANKNALGNQTLESILSNPNAVSVTRYHALYGDVYEIRIPGGMGARFSADGNLFIGFLE